MIAVVLAADAVGIGFLTNVVTGGALPIWLEPYRGWAWATLAVLTLVGMLGAFASFHSSLATQKQDATPPLVSRASNLPHRNPRFAGRARELSDLKDSLSTRGLTALVAQARRDPHSPPSHQALLGMPGVGKSQLAIEYAHRYRSSYDIAWWIEAETPSLIEAQLAKLGNRLLLPPPDNRDWASTVLAELQLRGRWLLIFDDVASPENVVKYLPDLSSGHVITTSRNQGWGEVATPLTVGVFSPEDAREYLRKRLPTIRESDSDELAERLGFLPLALAQAAAYIEECGLSTSDYLSLLRSNESDMLSRGRAHTYPYSVQETIELALTQVRSRSKVAVQLLYLYAFLAPDSIPDGLTLGHGKSVLPRPLAGVAVDPLLWNDTIGLLNAFSLVDRNADDHTADVHRLVQTVIRSLMTPAERTRWLSYACNLLGKAFEQADPTTAAELSAHLEKTNEHLRESTTDV